MVEKSVLLGNEAIARGAWESGCKFAASYPGTPATEILENIAKHYKKDIRCQWATNEKVAVDVAIGASFGGVRALASMKHVGVNVAADALMTLSETGVNGGFVIVSADDPGMHSSQNEQDNRLFGKFAKIPVLEPSDSQEAKDFVKIAFWISEEYDLPVMVRLTTRVSHSRSVVTLEERTEIPLKDYIPNSSKRVVIPANARRLHRELEERLAKLAEYSNEIPINRIEPGKTNKVGIITSGISYQYAKEILPDVWYLKLGLVYPFPARLLKEFAEKVEQIYVIEENEPFIEEQVRILGYGDKIAVGKNKIPLCGELDPGIIYRSLYGKTFESIQADTDNLPARPPVLCPGCPHRGIFYITRKLKLNATTDIGCYTLGVIPPLNAGETCLCMGASIGVAHGLGEARGTEFGRKVLAFIGDSTFLHGGLPGLLNVAYNKGSAVICILNNETTAMTGHQVHPGTGETLMGEKTIAVDYAEIAKALGIKNVFRTNAFDIKEIEKAVREAIGTDEPAVIVNTGRCILLDIKRLEIKPFQVDIEKCKGCGLCFQVGCPSIFKNKETGKAVIDELFCVGDKCAICAQVCPFDAIVPAQELKEKK